MIERHFDNWDYAAVQELEHMCGKLPIVSSDGAEAFFTQAQKLSGDKANMVERPSGQLFNSMMGFVRASDRKDFSASCDVSNPETPAHGVLMLETYDSIMPVTFCVARISENRFLTEGWIGEKARQAIKGLRSMVNSPTTQM